MTRKQIPRVLREHGFWSGRLIAHSKSGYRKRYPKAFRHFQREGVHAAPHGPVNGR